LDDGESAALRWSHRARAERDPVDLVLEDGSWGAMLFRAYPNMPVGPEGEGAEFLDGRMACWDGVADGEGGGVEDSDIAT
jgi:hypothetical protein